MAQALAATVRAVKSSRKFIPRKAALTLVSNGVITVYELISSCPYAVDGVSSSTSEGTVARRPRRCECDLAILPCTCSYYLLL